MMGLLHNNRYLMIMLSILTIFIMMIICCGGLFITDVRDGFGRFKKIHEHIIFGPDVLKVLSFNMSCK